MLASRPLPLRGGDFGFNAGRATQSTTGMRIAVAISLEWFHAAVPTPFVAKLRKPTVGLSASRVGGARPR